MSYWRQPLDRERVQVPTGIVHIIDERCKGCGFCVEFCPQRVLVMSHRINAKGYHPPELIAVGQCVNCGLCALLCPDFAIYVDDGGMHIPDQVRPIHRDEVQK
ncbi:MAG: 4Fe-4S binding protein [Anaerolineae bacterium]|nr:4Fe-4S binding protein [Anaerolineae bacterium]